MPVLIDEELGGVGHTPPAIAHWVATTMSGAAEPRPSVWRQTSIRAPGDTNNAKVRLCRGTHRI